MTKAVVKTAAELRHDAAEIQKDIDSLDAQIKKLYTAKTEKNRLQRGLINRATTIELRGK